MRTLTTLTLTAALLTISGCYHTPVNRKSAAVSSEATVPQPGSASMAPQGAGIVGSPKTVAADAVSTVERDVSLNEAEASQPAAAVTQRKIIRHATLSIEIDAPADGQRRIASIAEARGGFVVTSESRQQGGAPNGSKPYEVVTIEVRVPAAEFDAVVSEIRAGGGHVKEEKITGQDVTESTLTWRRGCAQRRRSKVSFSKS